MARGGAVLGLILIIVGFILFPLMLNSFDDIGKTEVSTSATVVTEAEATYGNITLNSSLLDDNLDDVIEISSTDTGDYPAPYHYYANTDVLEVSGLQADTSRTLAVDYYAERDTDYIGDIMPIVPFFIFLLFLAAGGGIIYKSVRR